MVKSFKNKHEIIMVALAQQSSCRHHFIIQNSLMREIGEEGGPIIVGGKNKKLCSPRPIFFVFLRLVIIFVRRRLRLVSRCGGLLPGLPGWQLTRQTAQEPAGPGIGRGGDGRRGWRRSGCGRQPFGQPPDPDAVEVLLKLHCHAVPYIVRIRWVVEKLRGRKGVNIHTHITHITQH